MNVVFSVDFEGASGIVSTKEIFESGSEFARGKEYLTHDTNAAVEGALEAGAKRIVVHDSHGLDQRNLLFDKLHPAAEVVRGTPVLFFENLQAEFDACFLIAAHSSYDKPEGVLNHLFSSVHFRSVRIDGRPICEGELSAALAGHLGIPTVLVTGDDVACAELKHFIPEIETAVVKQAISRYAASCLPLSRTEVLIREAAKNALIRVSKNEIPPYRYEGEKVVEIDLRTPYQAAVISELTSAERKAPCTIGYAAANVLEVYRLLRLVLYLVNSSLIP